MAYITGTAATPQALFNTLISFLKTNGALVGLSQQWTEPWTLNSNEMVLKGPGLSASENIYLGFKYIPDAVSNRYEIRLTGMTGIITGALGYDQHVNPSPDPVRIFLANQPMQYWFVASGRRFIVVVKVGTVYQSFYGGFFLPYSPPNNYTYPMFIGGSCGVAGSTSPTGISDITIAHSLYPFAAFNSITSHDSSAKMLDPAGQWVRATGQLGATLTTIGMGPSEQFSGFNTGRTDISDSYGYGNLRSRLETGLGSFILTPVTLLQTSPTEQTYGVLQGVNIVTGQGNSSENIITIAGAQHLVIQNIFRTAADQYMTVELV